MPTKAGRKLVRLAYARVPQPSIHPIQPASHPTPIQIELLAPGAGPKGEDVMASLYGSDVVLSNARNGQVIRVISCGEGEVRCVYVCWDACRLGVVCVCMYIACVRKLRSRGRAFLNVASPVNRFARLETQKGIGCEVLTSRS